jgi:hypothetical protein
VGLAIEVTFAYGSFCVGRRFLIIIWIIWWKVIVLLPKFLSHPPRRPRLRLFATHGVSSTCVCVIVLFLVKCFYRLKNWCSNYICNSVKDSIYCHHSIFSDPSPVIIAFLVTHQSSLFSVHHHSLFSDPSPVIVAFSVTHQSSLFSARHHSIFSDLSSPVIVVFSVTCQSRLFSVHHHSLFSDLSPIIVAFSVTYQSSLFSAHHRSLFCDPSPVIIAFSVTR